MILGPGGERGGGKEGGGGGGGMERFVRGAFSFLFSQRGVWVGMCEWIDIAQSMILDEKEGRIRRGGGG